MLGLKETMAILFAAFLKYATPVFGCISSSRMLLRNDGFHGDVIRLQSQKSEVLRTLIYTRLKINRK